MTIEGVCERVGGGEREGEGERDREEKTSICLRGKCLKQIVLLGTEFEIIII